MAKEGGGWGAYMAKPPPYGQKRDGHPFGQTPFGPDGQKSVWPSLWPSPTGCLHGQREGRTAPLAKGRGAYMAK
jgi:hypothetical protein